jgi:hypothetical protein
MNDAALAYAAPQEEALFQSAHSALLFAYTFSGDRYERPIINKLAAPSRNSGKGLGGVDGAAQAGMIRRETETLPGLQGKILIARIAPQSIPCDCNAACCSGKQPNQEWALAVQELTRGCMTVLSGCMSHHRLRLAIVQKYFGLRVSLSEIAEHCGVNRDTASHHNNKIVKHLRAEESKAWGEIEDKLRKLGVVG